MATKKKKKKAKRANPVIEVPLSSKPLEVSEPVKEEQDRPKARSTKKLILKSYVAAESGTYTVYISQVTEKTVKVIIDDKGCCYFSRFTGMAQGEAAFKIYGKSQLKGLQNIESFLALHGKEEEKADKSGITHTWKSLWRPRYNSRGEAVNLNTESLLGRSIEGWLSDMGYSVLVL